jgi:translation elongation factor P/translation initiation factor 5A
MIQATQLKRGMCIKHDNDLYRVVEAQHKTPGNRRWNTCTGTATCTTS